MVTEQRRFLQWPIMEMQHSFMLLRDFFFNSLTCTNPANYPGTKLLGVTFELKKRMQHLVIPRCCFEEDHKEMYLDLERTYKAIVFPH